MGATRPSIQFVYRGDTVSMTVWKSADDQAPTTHRYFVVGDSMRGFVRGDSGSVEALTARAVSSAIVIAPRVSIQVLKKLDIRANLWAAGCDSVRPPG